MKKWLSDNKKIIVFVIYVVVAFGLSFVHRNWRDESQAWLLARDCNILELISAMRYEGHMLLWNLILMPFAKLGFPYMTINIISLIIMCITVWLILDKAPFRFIYRVLFIMFFPVWYLYPVISRCYCLVPLAIVLMAIYYKDRKENPKPFLMSLVFLANTHVIMFGMVAVVLLDFLIELFFDIKNNQETTKTIKNKRKATKKRESDKEDIQKRVVWFGITVFILFLSVLPLLGCLETNVCVKQNIKFIEGLKHTFIYWPIGLISQGYMLDVVSAPCHIIENIIISDLLIIVLVFEMIRCRGTYLRILASVIYQLLVYAFIYFGSAQRAATIIFIVLYYKWIDGYNHKDVKDYKDIQIVKTCYIILLTLSILNGLWFIKNEIIHKASHAYEMADYINNNLPKDSIILSPNREEFTSPIIPYTGKSIKYYNITGGRYFSYTTWDRLNYMTITKAHIEHLKQFFNTNDNLCYLYRTYTAEQNEIDLVNDLINKGVFTKINSVEATTL